MSRSQSPALLIAPSLWLHQAMPRLPFLPFFILRLCCQPSQPSTTSHCSACSRRREPRPVPFFTLRHSPLYAPLCYAPPSSGPRGARLRSPHRPRHVKLSRPLAPPPSCAPSSSRSARHMPFPTRRSPTSRSDGRTCLPRSRPTCGCR